MINNSEYFSHLYEIATCLNKEFSLHSALKNALEKTVQLMNLETGWIWLMQSDRSVLLAASYNLPPALKEHPERLAGPCYCIQKYLSNGMDRPQNISEIACTRLKKLKTGTLDLKFHATVPITIRNKKTGLINLLSKESRQLSQTELCILHTVSELMAMAIGRTRSQDLTHPAAEGKLHEVIKKVVQPKLLDVLMNLETIKGKLTQKDALGALEGMETASKQAKQLQEQLAIIMDEVTHNLSNGRSDNTIPYPETTLSKRELELLPLIQKGFTNKQVAEALFISERTVKFHMASILSKLSAKTRTEAVNIALKRGLIHL